MGTNLLLGTNLLCLQGWPVGRGDPLSGHECLSENAVCDLPLVQHTLWSSSVLLTSPFHLDWQGGAAWGHICSFLSGKSKPAQCQDPPAHQQHLWGIVHWDLTWHCQGKLKKCFRNYETPSPSFRWGNLFPLPQLPPPHLLILSVSK